MDDNILITSPHFHTSKLEFAKSKKRDKDKYDWCELNNLLYVGLPYDESDEQWKHRIQNVFRTPD